MRGELRDGDAAFAGGLARYLQVQFEANCPPGWRCAIERPLLDTAGRSMLGYDPRADVLLERTDGQRRLWIEFEISRADPAANHAKFAAAHVLRPWGPEDAFIAMISSHVARGRRNLGAGMIHVMRQVGFDAFQTVLLPGLAKEQIKALNHDAVALSRVRPDVTPEIERAMSIAEPVTARSDGRLHFAADVFDVLLNLRRWNEDAANPTRAARWRRRSVRYVVVDPATGWCAPAKFAAYIVLPPRNHSSVGPRGIESQMTFERYAALDASEPKFDGHRAWTHLTRRLGFSAHVYGESADASTALDAWCARSAQQLLQIDQTQVTLLTPPVAFR